MHKKKLRKIAVENPREFRRYIRGARKRDIQARYLLLHPDRISVARPRAIVALSEYIRDSRWRSLYAHDRRMYRLLRAGAELITAAMGAPADAMRAATMRGALVRLKLIVAEGGSLSAEAAAKRLGISLVEITKEYEEGRVLAWRLRSMDSVRFPKWQFKNGRLLPGLPEVLVTLAAGDRLDDFGRMLFFLSRSNFLGQNRPLDYLRTGKVRDVLCAAQGFVCG